MCFAAAVAAAAVHSLLTQGLRVPSVVAAAAAVVVYAAVDCYHQMYFAALCCSSM